MGKVNLSELKKEPKKDVLKATEEKASVAKNIVEKAAISKQKKARKQLGRPQKEESERLSEKVTVNFTKAEYGKLEEISKERFDMVLPQLVRLLLKEKKLI